MVEKTENASGFSTMHPPTTGLVEKRRYLRRFSTRLTRRLPPQAEKPHKSGGETPKLVVTINTDGIDWCMVAGTPAGTPGTARARARARAPGRAPAQAAGRRRRRCRDRGV